MAGREHKMVDKVQPFLGQAVSYDFFGVCSAKFAKIFRGYRDPFDAACLNFACSKLAPINPALNLHWGNM